MMLATKTFHDTTSWPYYPDLDFAERWLPWGTPETFVYSIIGISAGILCGWLLYLLCRPFVTVRSRRSAVILGATLGGSAVMVIWIGDPNLLYTFPIFTALFMLTTRGDRVGRLAVCFIFFCMCMTTAALFDTYLGARIISYVSDLIARIGRCVVFLIIYLCFRRFLPAEPPQLSRRLWSLVFALSLMPLAALASTVLLTYPRYESEDVLDVSLRVGLGILPFVLVTSIVLLAAIIVLARQQALEEAGYLASLRENYYENLRALRISSCDSCVTICATTSPPPAACSSSARSTKRAPTSTISAKAVRSADRAASVTTSSPMSFSLPKQKRWSNLPSPAISASSCRRSSPSPIRISAPFSATPSTTPAKRRQASPAPLCGCAAVPTRGFSCSPSTIRSTEKSTPIFPPRNRTSAPTATGCRA